MRLHRSLAPLFSFLFILCASTVFGQNADQTYKVVVPQSIAITSPSAVQLTHDQTDNKQVFPAQAWVVRGNNRNGVDVKLEVATPFVHTQDSSFKVDAEMALSIASTQGAATWSVTKPTDKTNVASNDNDAFVTATSNGVGRANLSLSVTFAAKEWGTYASGEYVTTVVGTVTAK